MNFIKDMVYYTAREYLKTFDFSNIQQQIIDRKNDKTFDDIESYLKYHNKTIKPCYYHSGLGPNGIFGIAFLNYYDEKRLKCIEDFYFFGSSATSVYSILLNCKKKLNFNEWINKSDIKEGVKYSEAFNIIKNSYFSNFKIDDFKYDEIFINVLCYDIKNNVFKVIFFTNFIDMKDMLECTTASCFIPNVTCTNSFMYYDKYIIFDTGIIDNICTLNYKFLNQNIKENPFLKELFDNKKYPSSDHHFVKKMTFNLNNLKSLNFDFKNYYNKSLDNIKKN